MQDKLDNELLECRKAISKFHSGRRQLDAKMEEILNGTSKKDVPIAPITDSVITSPPSRNLADYKRSASDTILDATANCIVELGDTHPQLSRQDATKFCQQIAAQSAKPGGIFHIPIPRMSASVQEQEQIVPAWLRSNLIHRHEFEDNIISPPTPQIKNAKLTEDERGYDINAPSWLKVHDANPMTKMMAEHRFDKPKEDEQVKLI